MKIIFYAVLILMSALAVFGWQQASFLNQELMVKQATINNLMVSFQEVANRPPEIEYRIIEKPIEMVVYNIKTIYLDRPVDRIVIKEVMTPLKSAENLDYQWLFDFIAYASFGHQFYVQNPDLQTAYTGNTAWNLKSVEFYRQIQTLLSEIKERQ